MLSGANTYTGTTFVNGGTLKLGTAGSTGFTAQPGVTNTGGVLSVTWTKAASYPVSATLIGAWTPAPLGVGAGNVGITGNAVKYTFPAGAKSFARLKVTGP